MMYPKSLADALSKHRHAFINTDDTKQERDLALAFIAKCLVLDARDRATASQLLSHPWILNFEFGSKDLPPGLFYKNT
ncbi:hypothetical protein FA15DRAFT_671196 [Coprinopsis marcescibilis]|uniref:Protein kinase domain-containing protein n=1 Tax=Coprinopsis marcescibilis TaxID=230819 RepID=A0A5C3KQC7_COPMA|nr:hypothetical protein FA15DRAFT_671196 [Coprinopsis marcescibilis]